MDPTRFVGIGHWFADVLIHPFICATRPLGFEWRGTCTNLHTLSFPPSFLICVLGSAKKIERQHRRNGTNFPSPNQPKKPEEDERKSKRKKEKPKSFAETLPRTFEFQQPEERGGEGEG